MARRVRRPPKTGRKLEEYRRKRDFERTAEPAGDGRDDRADRDGRDEFDARRGGLQFVVQKHAASHLHYDLRLELDGVMKSWAVPKGPSLDPSVRRLAMQVEDHPIDYNTFEGTIPEGEYGGGTVMLWDRGTYSPDDLPRRADAEAVLRRGLEAGKLGVTLHGRRLRGSFALIRTDGGSKPKWLLIKHRDDHAEDESDIDITAEVLTSVATGRTMDEIAADSDRVWHSDRPRRRGRTRQERPTSVDSLVIAPMKATPAHDAPAGNDWSYEPWRGGTRALAFATADTARLIDERDRDITRDHRRVADELASLARRLGRPFVLDGEIAPDDDGQPVFHAWDLLLDGDDVLLERPWVERRSVLDAMLYRRRIRHVRRVTPDSDAERTLRRVRRRRMPGLLAHRLDEPYRPGAPSDGLIRVATR
jgi:bifunctional non-homologous end joining protein LigD